MNKKDKLIPEIRFPEFKNKEDWKVKSIDELCDVLNNIRKPISSSDRKKGTYPYYGASGIIDYVDNFLFDERLLLVGEDGAKWGAYENTAFLVDGKYWVNNHAHVLKPNLINDKLLESYLVKLDLHPYITGAAPPKLTLGKLKEIPIPFSENKIEQEKIASCLSSLDETIKDHSKKLSLLKEHKKSLMQNLFTQEGEKKPKYRFKEFEQDGDWADKTIDDVCKLVRGPFGGALKKEIFVKEGYAVYEQSHAIYSNFSSFRYFIDEDKFNELKRFSVKSGDLIMSCSGTMGKFAIVPEDCKIGVINQALLKLSVKKGFDKIFVKMTLEADNNQEKLLSQSAGGAIKNVVSVSQIKELSLLLPSIKEQQKIASCLSSLDELITAQAEKIEQLKLHKKGLMQGMFPKIID